MNKKLKYSVKYFDDSMTVRTVSNLEIRGIPKEGLRIVGEVLTRHGIVQAHSDDTHTNLRFCHNGRLYTRYLYRGYTVRGVCRMAAKFAKEKSK